MTHMFHAFYNNNSKKERDLIAIIGTTESLEIFVTDLVAITVVESNEVISSGVNANIKVGDSLELHPLIAQRFVKLPIFTVTEVSPELITIEDGETTSITDMDLWVVTTQDKKEPNPNIATFAFREEKQADQKYFMLCGNGEDNEIVEPHKRIYEDDAYVVSEERIQLQ
ncbi:hypothetical protein [Lactiplantibacillus plantarum]|uniref:hypothetical protein n=1 Tax=Lactiplantibacillus plantarum TaxID=1590 RepID=UPI001AAFC51E|nr:hypothetical protein [Lactiplantibacillus plantarum]MBO2705227.1 hypothetical protein [Lactiplantibacillus plantarum]MDN7037926.1 hypothetical protein [Lactiplantibacillus plantarum]MDO7795354.1 hypothetical protein [Lactiplantibacillus plantarum]WVI00457.1 hypothetical protein VZE42_07220 [Lactiplantibacillus plantarum]